MSASEKRLPGSSRNWHLVVCWVLGAKLAYLGVVYVVLMFRGDLDHRTFERVMVRWPREGGPVFASHFATWDAAHYLLLSEEGYEKGLTSCAFYPLWPALLRVASPLLGGSHFLTGLILANACSVFALTMFYVIVRRRWGEPSALWALIFLVAFPGALFLQFVYSESLFLLLAMGLWLALQDRRYALGAVCAGLLPICRGIGLFAFLPLAWHAMSVASPVWFADLRSKSRALRLVTSEGGSSPGATVWREGGTSSFRIAPWLVAALPVLGWGGYLAVMWALTGNAFEGVEAQKHWAVHSVGNLWNLPKFVVGFSTPTEWHAFRGSILDRCAFVLVIYCVPVLWRLDKELLLWAVVLGVVPAMSGTFTSFTRFASCAFPVFIALGVVFGRPNLRWLRYGLLSVFVVLHAMLLWRFVNFRWAG